MLLCVADCTGHGVPGAFMSMLGAQALTEITARSEELRPAKIITQLDVQIRQNLKQKETGNRDGMDMILLVLDRENRKLEFAGAKNSLIYIQNKELKTLKASRFSVGGRLERDLREYENREIELSEPTCFYLSTDGFQDQLGGPRGRKFMSKYFQELLLEIHEKPMEEQQEILNRTIEQWMEEGKRKQVDDICIVGAKI